MLAVAGDVPTAREHEPRAGRGMVEHGLSGAARVAVHAPRTSTTRTPSQPATARLITSRSSVAPGKTVMRVLRAVELADALRPARADDLVAAVKRVLGHVLAELAGDADGADVHRGFLLGTLVRWLTLQPATAPPARDRAQALRRPRSFPRCAAQGLGVDDEIESVRLTVADVVFQAARQLVRVGSVMSAGTATDANTTSPPAVTSLELV